MANDSSNQGRVPPEPFLYKSGVIQALHVRAFCHSDGNVVGDFLLDNAVQEAGHEPNNRSEWLCIPPRDILQLLEFQTK